MDHCPMSRFVSLYNWEYAIIIYPPSRHFSTLRAPVVQIMAKTVLPRTLGNILNENGNGYLSVKMNMKKSESKTQANTYNISLDISTAE